MPTIAPTPPYKALIFDCDGTLADSLPIHCQAWIETLRLFELEITEDWYYQRAGISTVELIEILNQRFDRQLDVNQVKTEKHRRFRAALPQIKPIAAVETIVRMHDGQTPMAIASGGGRSIVEATLDILGLRHLFAAIVTVEDVQRGKPAPDLFLQAAQMLAVSPADCIVYEDSDVGLTAAKLAGMRAVDVRSVTKITSH